MLITTVSLVSTHTLVWLAHKGQCRKNALHEINIHVLNKGALYTKSEICTQLSSLNL